ncbi:hypothetical protein Tco_0379015 [Tanacetum coccineum]
MLLMQAQENGVALDEEQLLFIAGGQDNVVDDDVDEQPVQDLALNVDNVFQADDCNAFDSDVDEAPTAQTMFMVNLSSADPVYDESSLSYDSNILSKVPDHDNYQDAACEHHEVHEMHDGVQPNYVVDTHADYTSDSNMIMYDQYVKENVITRAKHIEQTTALLTENENLKAQIHENLKCITMDSVKPKVLAPSRKTFAEIVDDVNERPLDSSFASACCYTKHSQELLEYVIDTCPKALNTRDNTHASTSLPKKKARVNSCNDASRSQPRSNTKKNRILPAKSVNMKKVEEHPRTIKSSLKTMNHVDSSISSKHTVVQIVLWYLDSGCSKHMMGDRSWLRNFMKKFIGTVRFGNDHFGAIIGFGDYVIGESVISRVYYVEGLRHNLFFVR